MVGHSWHKSNCSKCCRKIIPRASSSCNCWEHTQRASRVINQDLDSGINCWTAMIPISKHLRQRSTPTALHERSIAVGSIHWLTGQWRCSRGMQSLPKSMCVDRSRERVSVQVWLSIRRSIITGLLVRLLHMAMDQFFSPVRKWSAFWRIESLKSTTVRFRRWATKGHKNKPRRGTKWEFLK